MANADLDTNHTPKHPQCPLRQLYNLTIFPWISWKNLLKVFFWEEEGVNDRHNHQNNLQHADNGPWKTPTTTGAASRTIFRSRGGQCGPSVVGCRGIHCINRSWTTVSRIHNGDCSLFYGYNQLSVRFGGKKRASSTSSKLYRLVYNYSRPLCKEKRASCDHIVADHEVTSPTSAWRILESYHFGHVLLNQDGGWGRSFLLSNVAALRSWIIRFFWKTKPIYLHGVNMKNVWEFQNCWNHTYRDLKTLK